MDTVYIPKTRYKVWQVKEILIVQAFVSNIFYSTKVTGVDFKKAISNSLYQMIQ